MNISQESNPIPNESYSVLNDNVSISDETIQKTIEMVQNPYEPISTETPETVPIEEISNVSQFEGEENHEIKKQKFHAKKCEEKSKPNLGRKWNCEFCAWSFSRRSNLARHCKSVHDKVIPKVRPLIGIRQVSNLKYKNRKWQCEFCTWSFARKANLVRHCKSVHKEITSKFEPVIEDQLLTNKTADDFKVQSIETKSEMSIEQDLNKIFD